MNGDVRKLPAKEPIADAWIALSLYIGNLIVHFVLLAFPPAVFYYSLDELHLTQSCLDQFLGLPSTAMEKPAAIVHMLSVPVFLTDFIVRQGISSGLSRGRWLVSFSRYLADA